MRNYEQKINELGLEKGKLSKNLNQEVKEFEQADKEFLSLSEQLLQMSEEDEGYEEVSNEVSEYAELLETTDAQLTDKIQKYFDKKDYYAAKMEHMQKKAAEKRGGEPAPAAAPVAAAAPKAAPITQPAAAAPAAQAVVVEEEKKKSGGNWILWGGLAVLGLLVGVNVLKNRE